MSRELQIAAAITAYLIARADRLATDHGMLRIRGVAGALVVELDGVAYDVTITARKR